MADRTLHIAQGGSGAACLRQVLGVPDTDVLEHFDSLSAGPLPRMDDLPAWTEIRRAFWNEIYSGGEAWDLAGPNFQRLRDCDVLNAWVGTGVANQLTLPWLIARSRREAVTLPQVAIVQFQGLPQAGAGEILDLGMLSPDTMRELRPAARHVSPSEIEHLADTWNALTAPDPGGLAALATGSPGAFPYLHRALRTTLERYPEKASGLSHWDRALLESVGVAGPSMARTIGHVIATSYDSHYPDAIGDMVLFERLLHLGDPRLPTPAVRLEGEGPMYRCRTVALTDAGRDFLEGRRNFVEENGIDEWVAGVHLSSKAGRVWFRAGETLERADRSGSRSPT